MSKLTAVIVDDEQGAREVLNAILFDNDIIEVVGLCGSADEALKLCINDCPDVIFLDIQMPNKTGFDLVEDLKKYRLSPEIIFVTAYNQFAIKAIKASAFDYLLKPIDQDDLLDCIYRLKLNINKEQIDKKIDSIIKEQMDKPKKIRLNTRTGFLILSTDDIVCCVSDGNYTEIYLKDGKKEISSTNLSKTEESLTKDFLE